jgi:hypothetical protein
MSKGLRGGDAAWPMPHGNADGLAVVIESYQATSNLGPSLLHGTWEVIRIETEMLSSYSSGRLTVSVAVLRSVGGLDSGYCVLVSEGRSVPPKIS